ncbi:response regulator transcription factor [Camelimonas fluminis]|uniref:Response regulator transcription factor n=1 Tax=Camelimonas fluminis TaxID=1576911 RepID=A0ABV7UE61_9HYPH|nr:response regulator transcription factor [Camelimonas fluminis]
MENTPRDEPPVRTLLVEDDEDLRQGLADYLRLSGVDVTEAGSGVGFYRALRGGDFDVAILDVNLPDVSGFELARDLAPGRGVGVIMLTARAGRDDRMRGYAEGADIYLTKPVDSEELLHVTRNLARRVRDARAPQQELADEAPPQGWRLDARRQQLEAPDGAVISLSGRELMLLERMALADGATVPRLALAQHLGYGDASVESRSLDAVLRRLRQKSADGGVDLPLRAVHAVGLRFTGRLTLV